MGLMMPVCEGVGEKERFRSGKTGSTQLQNTVARELNEEGNDKLEKVYDPAALSSGFLPSGSVGRPRQVQCLLNH